MVSCIVPFLLGIFLGIATEFAIEDMVKRYRNWRGRDNG